MAQTNLFYKYDTDTGLTLDTLQSALAALVSSETDMETIDAAGGVKCWIMPRPLNGNTFRIFKACSPVIVQSVAVFYAVGDYTDIPSDADYTEISVNGTTYTCYTNTEGTGQVEFNVYRNTMDGTPIVTLTAYEIEGVAEFNVGSIAVGLMNSEMSDDYRTELAIDEGYLYRSLYLHDFSNMALRERYMFIRAVAQYGESTYIDTNISKPVLLTKYPHIYAQSGGLRYDNYVTVVLPVRGAQFNITLQSTALSLTDGKVYNLYVGSSTDAANINSFIGEQVVTYKSISDCNNIWVRWIDDAGGLDTFPFPYRQEYTDSVKTTGVAQHSHSNGVALIVPENVQYSIEQTRTLKVGVEGVTDATLQVLKGLARSPYIEFFYIGEDVYNGTWVRVYVEKYEMTQQTDLSSFDYEITLHLPDYNTQF